MKHSLYFKCPSPAVTFQNRNYAKCPIGLYTKMMLVAISRWPEVSAGGVKAALDIQQFLRVRGRAPSNALSRIFVKKFPVAHVRELGSASQHVTHTHYMAVRPSQSAPRC
jgi:hypothetical protein